MKFLNKKEILKTLVLVSILTLGFSTVSVDSADFSEPGANPIGNNTPFPITISGDQSKSGSLEVLGISGDGFCLGGECVADWDDLCTFVDGIDCDAPAPVVLYYTLGDYTGGVDSGCEYSCRITLGGKTDKCEATFSFETPAQMQAALNSYPQSVSTSCGISNLHRKCYRSSNGGWVGGC